MEIKCAIFDFDGTLFDSMFIWDGVGEAYLRSRGVEPGPSLVEDLRALSLYQSACYLQREYGLPLSVEEIMDGINALVEELYLHRIQPKAGVVEFLERLKARGIPMCIATASEARHIRGALRRCGMERYFDAIFTCTEVGHGKDEPVIFREAMEHFSADRGSTVVFEDALHAARTAKDDGFTLAAVFDESEDRQEALRALADCDIPDFEHTEDFWRMVDEDENSPFHCRQ